MADIGATLREARMRAKIDINEVETRTKIRAKYLRAMENEEWDLLPGEVYVKSFLRTYGEYLGLDTRQLIDDFKRRYERPSDNELRPIAPLGRERERQRHRPLVPPWALIGVVLVGVVVALYLVGKGSGGKATPPMPTTPRTGATHHPRRRTHHQATVKTATRPSRVRLQLVPTGPTPVYVCLVNGSGKKLISGQIFNVGQTIPTETSSKLLLTLGNASVKMKINGVAIKVTPSSSAIGYLLVPGAQSLLPASKQPRCA
jgi:cytoskeleton protein RodZ